MNYGTNLKVLLEGWLEAPPDIALSALTPNPAEVRENSVFVALDGRQAPLREAIANGCIAVLHDERTSLSRVPVPVVAVPGLDNRLGELASRFWAAPSDLLTIAAVAGQQRRHPVAHYLAQVWQRSCGRAGMFGSSGHGPMDTLQPLNLATADVFTLNQSLAACLDQGVERMAVEIPAESLQRGRCQTLQIDLALITDIHSREGGPAVERALFTEFAPTFAVVNHHDPVCRHWIQAFGGQVEILSYGLDDAAELSVRIVTMDADGMALRFNGPWGEANVLTDFRGKDQALNLLATVGALVLLGLDWHQACRQLEYLRPIPLTGPNGTASAASSGSLERAA